MASHKTLLVPLIQEILVKEIGEANIPPLNWKKRSATIYEFPVKIEKSKKIVTVAFSLFDDIEQQYYFPPKYKNLDDVYNVSYDVAGIENQFAKTDLKTLLTILSTVVDIVKDFIKNEDGYLDDINGLYIRGTSKEMDGEDISQKSNLYKAFISKQLQQIPNFGFDTYKNGFILVKK